MRLKPTAGSKRSRQRGVAAVEFALILPFIAVLILAMVDYGYYFYIGINATEAARATAVQMSASAAALNAGAGVSSCSDPLIATVTGPAPALPAQTAKTYMLTAVNATFAGYTTASFTCTVVTGKAIFGVVVTVDFPPVSGSVHFGLPRSTTTTGHLRYRTPILYRR
jgi:Flp pilus assembly protein TadG